VTVDGQPVKSEHVLRDGQLIETALADQTSLVNVDSDNDIYIYNIYIIYIYIDKWWMVA
jgi:hypothetical protein